MIRHSNSLPCLRSAALVLAVLCASPVWAGDLARASAYYEDGLQRFEKGDVDGAVVQLKNALQQDGKMLSAHVLLGRALLEKMELPAAEAAFEEALKLGVSPSEIAVPRARLMLMLGQTKALLAQISVETLSGADRVEVLTLLGAAHADQRQEAEALASFEAAIATDPTALRPYLDLVPFHLRNGQREAALAAVARALEIAPDDARAWNLSASIKHAAGDLGGALDDYERALSLDANFSDARVARASLLVDLARDDEAGKDLEILADQVPSEPRAAYLRAVLAGRRGDTAAVETALRDVIRLIDGLPQAYVNEREQLLMLGSLSHQGLGNREKAKAYLDTLLARFPRNLAGRKLMGEIYMSEGDGIRTLKVIEPVLRAQPDDPQSLLLAGRAHLVSENYLRAIPLLERAASILKNDPRAQIALSQGLIGGGRLSEGADQLEAALAVAPEDTGASVVLVSVLLQRGETDKALARVRQLVARQPGNPVAQNLLGVVLAAGRDPAGARAAYQQAISLDEKFVPAYLNLARLEAQLGEIDAARARLLAVSTRYPDDASVMYELGRLEQQEGYLEMAIDWFRKAVAKRPDDRVSSLALAEALSAAKLTDQALTWAKETALRHPEDLDVQAALARAYLDGGQESAANQIFTAMTRIAQFDADEQVTIARLRLAAGFALDAQYNVEKALAADRQHLPAMAMAVEVALARGDAAAAHDTLNALEQAHPGSAAGTVLRARVLRADGKVKAALAAYDLAYAQTGTPVLAIEWARAAFAAGQPDRAHAILASALAKEDRPELRTAAAQLSIERGDWRDAKQHLAVLLSRAPKNPELLAQMANVKLNLGEKDAIEVAETAARLAPTSADILDTLGWVLLSSGQVDRALGLLRDARLRAPANPEIRYHLAVALHKAGRADEAREELAAALARDLPFHGREAALVLNKALMP